jgi:hypothetical protein
MKTQNLGAFFQNSVAPATWRPVFVHPCDKNILVEGIKEDVIKNILKTLDGTDTDLIRLAQYRDQ